MEGKKYMHIVSDGKLIGIEYGYPDEIRKSLPQLRKTVAKIRRRK